ncbi:hypothetical protein AX14_000052 [Amanita brunnescens Koide BX004]|nr:hypothetical protein AX14_000052 [Amanita brunnescens Koide BX004]
MSSSTRSSGRARNIESLLSGSGGQARSIETLLSGNLAWSRNGESMAHLRPSRPASFEPRIVRASPESPCPPSTSAPALRTRRPSVGPPRLPTLSPSFPRPSYLDHSTLRHMLQTELPPALPPSRSADPQVLRFGPVSPSTDSDDDSTASPPRDPAPAPPPSVPASDHALRLPTRWSDQMKHSSLSVSADGRDLTFNGSASGGDRDAAAARTTHPIPPACGIYYYEVSILSKGQKGHISIGFVGHDVKLNRLPGWEQNSWGYHGDDGCSFAAEKSGNPYGPIYGTGDVIGCGIDFTTNKAFFTKNGNLLGSVFEGIGRDIEIYPSVGLRHNGESIRVNFGHEPFKFDIDYHVQQQRNSTWRRILSTPLDSSFLSDLSKRSSEEKDDVKGKYNSGTLTEEQTKSMISSLVLSYLIHHGYAKTAHSLQKQQALLAENLRKAGAADQDMVTDNILSGTEKMDLSTLEDDIERRTRIVNAVVTGNVDLAISETAKYHPLVLEAEAGLMLFRLRCRKFVELVLEASELKKKRKAEQVDKVASMEVDDMEDMDWVGMEIDDELREHSDAGYSNGFVGPPTSVGLGKRRESTTTLVEQALNRAIAYGQSLANDYKADARPEVKQLFKRTFAIVAWDDPREAGGVVAEVVSPEARISLANELNQAILKSQGHPTRPALEMLYRHTTACMTQLGLLGVGAAAFVDMPRELLGDT